MLRNAAALASEHGAVARIAAAQSGGPHGLSEQVRRARDSRDTADPHARAVAAHTANRVQQRPLALRVRSAAPNVSVLGFACVEQRQNVVQLEAESAGHAECGINAVARRARYSSRAQRVLWQRPHRLLRRGRPPAFVPVHGQCDRHPNLPARRCLGDMHLLRRDRGRGRCGRLRCWWRGWDLDPGLGRRS